MTLAIIIALTVLGVPLATVMGIGALYYMLDLGNPAFLRIVPQMMVSGMYKFPLMAIPFFIMSGLIMSRSGITDKIVRFVQYLIGSVRGGLAYVNIMASVLLAGVSGSAVADAAALGPILIPAMEKDGYPRLFSAAVTASSAIIGPIIPPSLIAIIYASTISGVSVAALFAAGIIPGLLLAAALCALVFFMARKHNFPISQNPAFSLRELMLVFTEALPSLLMPIIILGGILFGVFTATEAGAVAIFYAALVVLFSEKKLTLKDIHGIMVDTAAISGVVYLLIGTSMLLQWVIGKEHLAELITAGLTNITNSRWIMLGIIAVVIVVIGMFLDTSPAILLFAPLLAPIADKVGINSLHLAMVMIVGLAGGLVTPPLGVCTFVTCSIAEVQINDLTKSLWPFLVVILLVYILIVFVPWFSMFVPRLLGYI